MTKTRLGRTGYDVARLGFGSAPVGFLKTEQQSATDMLNWMLDQGVNLIDTAAMYPGAEQLIGDAVGHRRDHYVLVSKCGQKIPESTGGQWSPETIGASIDRSLKWCRTDHIDVMLLHSCDLSVLEQGDAVAALIRARDQGKVRYAGYSGDNAAAAVAAAMPDIAVIETSVNITDQANIDLVLPVCKKHDVGVLAKRPIANAAWKDLSQQPGFYKDYAKTYSERFAAMGLNSESLGISPDGWAELALRFTLAQDVHCLIVGTTRQSNAQRNLDALAKGPLPPEQVKRIRDAFRSADPDGKWSGQT